MFRQLSYSVRLSKKCLNYNGKVSQISFIQYAKQQTPKYKKTGIFARKLGWLGRARRRLKHVRLVKSIFWNSIFFRPFKFRKINGFTSFIKKWKKIDEQRCDFFEKRDLNLTACTSSIKKQFFDILN